MEQMHEMTKIGSMMTGSAGFETFAGNLSEAGWLFVFIGLLLLGLSYKKALKWPLKLLLRGIGWAAVILLFISVYNAA